MRPLAHLAALPRRGLRYQGEPSAHRGGARARRAERGTCRPAAFVDFLQNHDQIGNRAFGERLAGSRRRRRCEALTAVHAARAAARRCCSWARNGRAASPSCSSATSTTSWPIAVREGRRKEFARFPAFRDPAPRARIPDPNAEDTFRRSRLDWTASARSAHARGLGFCTRAARDLRATLMRGGAAGRRRHRASPPAARSRRAPRVLDHGRRLQACGCFRSSGRDAPAASSGPRASSLFASHPSNTRTAPETGRNRATYCYNKRFAVGHEAEPPALAAR